MFPANEDVSTVKTAVFVPGDVGSKVTETVQLWPTGMTEGHVVETVYDGSPVTVAPENVTGTEPEEEMVKVLVTAALTEPPVPVADKVSPKAICGVPSAVIVKAGSEPVKPVTSVA